jgi:hypothetical protein
MGGRGSGNWQPRFKKSTVEESVGLAIWHFQQAIHSRSNDEFRLTWEVGFDESSVGGLLSWASGKPTMTLGYRVADEEDVHIPVRLQTTPTNFNGERWWFVCPLIVGGVECNRRVSKLYLPAGERYFGCRHCHDLTHRSCQMTRARRSARHAA